MKTNPAIFSILTLLLTMTIQTVRAQELKDTPVGKLGNQLVAVINSGDKDVYLQFINEHFDLNASHETAEKWLNRFAQFHDETGGIEIIGMQPARAADEVLINLKAKNGGPLIDMFTRLSRDEQTRLIGFILRLGPLTSGASTWPKTKLTEPEVIKEIERHVNDAVASDRFSGAILIVKNDKPIYAKAYGLADKEKGVSNQTNTKFNMGSMNKMFTSVAIAQLVQAGKLSFSDTLASVLPDYPNKEVARQVTIAQLLSHTAGLGDFFKPDFFSHIDQYVTLRSYLPLFASEPLLFKPGTDWRYSNAGFIVLGIVLERVSGENYFDYVKKHIFLPTNMKNTDSYKRDDVVSNLAIGYMYDDEKDPLHKQPRQNNYATLPVMGSSAGGGYSTSDDMARFASALMKFKLVNQALMRTITTGKISDGHPGSKYAYGFVDRMVDDHHTIGHTGGAPGINGSFTILPDNHYVVIVMSNYGPPGNNFGTEITDFLVKQ